MQIGSGLLFLGSFSVTLESDIFIQSMLHPLTTVSEKRARVSRNETEQLCMLRRMQYEELKRSSGPLLTALKTLSGLDSFKNNVLVQGICAGSESVR